MAYQGEHFSSLSCIVATFAMLTAHNRRAIYKLRLLVLSEDLDAAVWDRLAGVNA
jgi:hypothetical protein